MWWCSINVSLVFNYAFRVIMLKLMFGLQNPARSADVGGGIVHISPFDFFKSEVILELGNVIKVAK